MKKTLILLCVVLLLSALLTGCGGKTPDASGGEALPKDMYFEHNGAKFTVGMKFAEVKDALGAQSEPDQVILPCDDSDAYKDTMHFYNGLTVTENIDGVISNIEVMEGDATLKGKVKVGDKHADAIAALGEPSNPVAEDDFSLTYQEEGAVTLVFLDPDTNKETVSGMTMFLQQP